jgi:hypothetical protein
MPRKLIPPSEPLPVDPQERLEVFKKYTVEHAMLIRKDDELTQRIWEPGGFAFLLLSGPTGIGKSELLKQACRVVSGREAKKTELQTLMDHWPLFYRGVMAASAGSWLLAVCA